MSAHRVLHVLPHPGGGAERYASLLEGIPGHVFERFALTERPRPAAALRGAARLRRRIGAYDLIHVHGDAAALVCLPLIGRRPTVITLHGAHLLRRAGRARGPVVRVGLRLAFRRAAAVICVSESEQRTARELVGDSANLRLVLNGVPEQEPIGPEERRAARDALGVGLEGVAVLFVGELAERKQPLQLAQAVRRARDGDPRIVALLAGEGPLAPALEQLAGEGVRPLGRRDDVRALLAAADVFVLPSLREGLAYAVLEAMAAGVPVLASDAPGNPDAVGQAGMLFRAGDTEAMVTALERLAADPALRDSLGRAGAARARERFALSRMLEQTAAVYEEALGGR
jgi:glycosyltransferase involved in cell wall biosynthesis